MCSPSIRACRCTRSRSCSISPRRNLGVLNYASAGIGSFQHLSGELFKLMAGVNIQHVPYKGGGPAMLAVIAGEDQVMFSSIVQTVPNIQSGQLRALATGGEQRSRPPTCRPSVNPSCPAMWRRTGGASSRRPTHRSRSSTSCTTPSPDFWIWQPPKIPRQRGCRTGPYERGRVRKFIESELAKWGPVVKQAGMKAE